jgi:HK97 family phage portal protein
MSATRRSLTTRITNLFRTEQKASLAAPDVAMFELFGAMPSASGIRVTPRIAMQCAPVAAAVGAISQAIGQLPVHVYLRGPDGSKERAPDHPAYALLHDQANEWTPATKFREELTRDALLYRHGGFAFINRVDGKPVELLRLDPETTPVTVDWSNGEPVYSVQEDGQTRSIPRENILHIPSPSLSGMGLAHDAREVIGLSLLMERHAARLFANGARPSGLLSLKGNVTADALTKAKASWQAAHGGSNSGGTAVVPADADWQSLTLTSVDAQFLELRRFQIDEVCRIFRIPPHLIYEMGRATWSNSAQLGQEFLDFSLMHWITAFEGEIRLKLFNRDERALYFAEFDTDGFARSDLAARMDAYSKAIASRILNPNEARAAENRAPYAGGEKFENPAITTTTPATPAVPS